MDFASLMAKEISKAKGPSPSASEKKYQKRSDIEAERRANYIAEQKRLESERAAKAAQKRQLEEEEAEKRRIRDEKRRKLAEESARHHAEEAERENVERRTLLGLPERVV